MTLVLVTHDDTLARACSRVVRLRSGEIEAEQSHMETLVPETPMSEALVSETPVSDAPASETHRGPRAVPA
jgi:ABC-type sulfate/molybdate transport systems ATPase subunit